MDRRELLGGLFWLGISIFVCLKSIENDLGTFSYPGPGLFPFLSSLIIGAFAAFLLVDAYLNKRKTKITDLWKGIEWKKVIGVLLSLFLYPLVLPRVGYLISTFALVGFLLGSTGSSKAWVRGISALIVTIASYVVFYILLGVRLPKGLFGL